LFVPEEKDAEESRVLFRRIEKGLSNMGLDLKAFNCFCEFPMGVERQGARYAWLMFAADIAEEQGV
jgi:hypothetical protein